MLLLLGKLILGMLWRLSIRERILEGDFGTKVNSFLLLGNSKSDEQPELPKGEKWVWTSFQVESFSQLFRKKIMSMKQVLLDILWKYQFEKKERCFVTKTKEGRKVTCKTWLSLASLIALHKPVTHTVWLDVQLQFSHHICTGKTSKISPSFSVR